ncbi:MAG: ATP-dependent DNA helicase [Spirochaetia bacterium]|nr:ATP-dependent DNA helicase [Spirochaetia bacterium]
MTNEQIEDIFDKGGLLSTKLKTYEIREGQIQMVKLITEAYKNDSIAIIEAGTGIGKSYAYLVPAIYNSIENGDERTVISTATINLQDQLFKKDIPTILDILNVDCNVALAIGRGNYLCLRRFSDEIAKSPAFLVDPDSKESLFKKWSAKTETGLLTEYHLSIPFDRSKINSDGELCLNFKCPYYKECFFQKSKIKLQKAKIIVSNHHLLFTDSKSRKENDLTYAEDNILPAFNRLIIDEAHNIEDTASEFFSIEYSNYFVLKKIENLLSSVKKGEGKNLVEKLGKFSTQGFDHQILISKYKELKNLVTTLNQYLLQTFEKQNYKSVYVVKSQEKRLSNFIEASTQIIKKTEECNKLMEQFLKQVEIDDNSLALEKEVETSHFRIVASVNVLKMFIDFASWSEDEIHWFDAEWRRSSVVDISTIITPLDISNELVENIFKELSTVVLTSATLDLSDDFKFWTSRIGLPYDQKRTFLKSSFLSPFDYENKLLLLTPLDALPPPAYCAESDKKALLMKKENEDKYLEYISEMIFNSINSSNGGALVLFTSKDIMNKVYKIVEDKFEKASLTLLIQGNSSKHKLITEFKNDDNSSLFALSSFWEGVDAPGNTLRLVIIVKLPFQVPSHPVVKARTMDYEKRGESGFFNLSLPLATMKLKQGFGRLMRSTADYGVVLLLDSRISQKSYGQYMLRALPNCFHPETSSSGVCDKIEDFLYSRKD